ncbi:MAG: hypothetical protein IT162_15015 [Bryobacterales bacterium]|nr:hypothetical protein [Bryobacterales bacterium]
MTMDPNGEQEVSEALAQWRAQDREIGASARVREIVVAALPPAPAVRRPAAWDWRPWAMAAAVLLTFAAVWLSSPGSPPQPQTAGAAHMATDFFPLTPAGLEPADPAQVVRIKVPRREMRRFGLPVREELERAAVEAEVLVGPDGVARAVRFVQEREFE